MRAHTETPRNHRLMFGFVIGTAVGAALTMWFAPRVAGEVRQRLTRSARRLTRRAAAQYHEASDRLGARVDELAGSDPDATDDAAATGTHAAEHGRAVKTHRPAVGKHSTRDHQASRVPVL